MDNLLAIKQEFIDKFVDNNLPISKSYYNNGKWNISRCRIEPSLIPELIYDYLFNNKMNSQDLCEFYLRRSREIQLKSNINYKESNGMDSSAILKWFKLKKDNNTSFNYSYDDIVNTITEYVNDIIQKNKFDNVFFEKWDNFYKRANYTNVIKEIEKYNVNNFFIVNDKINRTKDISINIKSNIINDTFNNEILEKIGHKGEEIVYFYLQEKYKKKNVKWVSKENKYSPYDFELLLSSEKIYIEVKSTTSANYFNFFMSRNEYYTYLNNKDHYWLIFVSNITNENNYIPNITIYKKPNILINNDKVGFDGDNIFISPFNYFCI